MSTTLEERLAAALEARADLVGADDLHGGPPPLPEPQPEHPRWRKPVVLAAAAAAVVAAVAVPVALQRTSSGPDPAREPTGEPTPSPSVDASELPAREGPGTGWPVEARTRADLDGDGTPDVVRLRVDPAVPDTDAARVEAELSSDPEARPWGLVPKGGLTWGFVPQAVEMDGDPGDELLVDREVLDGWAPVAVDLVGDRLALADPEVEGRGGPAPILRGTRDGRLQGWTVVDGRLLSWRSQESYDVRGEGVGLPEQYTADAWTWELDRDPGGEPTDLVLLASGGEERCVDGGEVPAPGPCGGSGATGQVDGDAPAFFPSVQETLGLGEPLQVESGGGPVSVELSGSGDSLALAVTVGDGPTQRVALPAWSSPVLVAQPLRTVEAPAFAVHGRADFVEEWAVVGFRNGEATLLPVDSDVPLVTGLIDGGWAAQTWVSDGGELFTSRAIADDGSGRGPVVRWLLDAGDGLKTEDLGTWCVTGVGSSDESGGRC